MVSEDEVGFDVIVAAQRCKILRIHNSKYLRLIKQMAPIFSFTFTRFFRYLIVPVKSHLKNKFVWVILAIPARSI